MLQRSRSILSVTAVSATLALLGACAGEPTIQTGEDAEVVLGTLNRVDNTQVDLAYVDPDGEYGRFQRVLVMPLDVDHVEIIDPNSSGTSMLNRYERDWELTEEDKTRLQEAFKEAMEEQLTDDGAFELATEMGDDVVVVEAMLRAIAPSAPRDDAMSRGTGRSRVFTEGAGGMSIAMSLADGHSGEILVLIKDTRNNNNATWGVNNSVSNWAEVRRNFKYWGGRLRDGLTAMRERAGG